MTEKESTINKYFWSDFSKIYKKPELIDVHLAKNSDQIEKIIINSFIELGLIKIIQFMQMVVLEERRCFHHLTSIFQ